MRLLSRSLLAVFTIMGLAAFSSVAKANDVYISQGGGGAGSSCSSPLVYTYFNTSSNWTSGTPTGTQIGPGTTVHLCGTFTAAAGTSGYLTFQGSGTSGNIITLHFESGAVIQAPYWGYDPVIGATSLSYIAVDGGTNGTIQATLAGSVGATCLGGSCQYQPASAGNGVALNSCSNAEVKNLTVQDLYIHTSTGNDPNGNSTGASVTVGTNITVDHNTFHDLSTGIWGAFSPGTSSSGYFFHDNTMYNINWGIAGGDTSAGATISNILIYNNVIHDAGNWDSSSDYWHHDGIYYWITNSTSQLGSPYAVYNNHIYSFGGTCTADIFGSNGGSSSSYATTYIFNNLLDGSGCGDGAIDDWTGTFQILNNTIYLGWPTGTSGPLQSASQIKNNISSGGIDYASASIASSDYNDWFNLGNPAMVYNGVFYSSLASYVSATGFDTHSITSNPNLSAIYVPNSGSPVIGAGTNLYSVCNGQPNPGLGALCYDAAGNPRPSSGNWTMGAYGPAGGGAPDPPTNLAAIAH